MPAELSLVLLPGMDGTGRLFEPFLANFREAWRPIVVRYPTDRSLGYAELLSLVEAASRRTARSCCSPSRFPALSPSNLPHKALPGSSPSFSPGVSSNSALVVLVRLFGRSLDLSTAISGLGHPTLAGGEATLPPNWSAPFRLP